MRNRELTDTREGRNQKQSNTRISGKELAEGTSRRKNDRKESVRKTRY